MHRQIYCLRLFVDGSISVNKYEIATRHDKTYNTVKYKDELTGLETESKIRKSDICKIDSQLHISDKRRYWFVNINSMKKCVAKYIIAQKENLDNNLEMIQSYL